MKREDFKYTTKFDQVISASADIEKDLDISVASLDSLKPLIPKSVNLEENIDLIGTAFNAAVVNQFNKNQEGIDSEAAVELSKYFVHKPTNIEHKSKNIVGHIVNFGYSDYKTNKIITPSEAAALKDPYYISLSAVVYKILNPDFSEVLLDSNDPESPYYQEISASWELGFNDFYIALGSEQVSEAEIIKDEKQIKELKKYLNRFGGSGEMDDGTIVRRLIIGDIFPLGIGYTTNPAADVKGVFTESSGNLSVEEDDEASYKKDINTEKISQTEKTNVENINTNKIMEPDQIKQEVEKILASKSTSKNEFTETAVANLTTLVVDALKDADKRFVDEREKTDSEKALAKQEAEQAKASVSKLEKDLEDANSKITELQKSIAERESLETFNGRMETIEAAYELEKEDRVIVAKEVKALDNKEESFASYQEKLTSFLSHKSKANIAKAKEELDARVAEEVAKELAKAGEKSKASVEDKKEKEDTSVKDAIEKTEASEKSPVNNNGNTGKNEDVFSRIRKNFQDQVEIKN